MSVAQIQSQIDVLNEDFSRTNPDVAQTPNVFDGVASNPMFRFELACLDPNSSFTTGITRTASGTANFDANRNGVKFTSQGGINAWPTDRYLNIWVAPNIGGVLGFAQPVARLADEPNTDGVVIWSDAFGRGAGFILDPQYDLGRTVTHEVGHWLNLVHIWGPNNGGQGANCNDTDDCNDTPNQSIENFGVPAATQASCDNGGDMFMNYMDYTDDVAMNLFTNDQRARMRALFMQGGVRAGFIDNYFSLALGNTTCALSLYQIRTPFCQANGNIVWSITGPATSAPAYGSNTLRHITPQSGANGTAVLTASWNNFTDDFTIPIGYGTENSTYNPGSYNIGNANLRDGVTHMTGYNRYTYIDMNFTGAIGQAKNWRLVNSSHQIYISSANTTNNFWIYMTQPYAFATIRAEIPTICGDKTVEYSFLSGYLNNNYAISPNPASNEITISASAPSDPNNRTSNVTVRDYEVQIFNSFNQLLKKTKSGRNNSDVTIDISRFPSNQFYTVKLISNDDVQTKSFFKQ